MTNKLYLASGGRAFWRLPLPGHRAQGEERDPAEVPVSVSAAMGEASGEGRYSPGRDPAEILQKAQTYESLGVNRLVISSNARDGAQMLAALEMLSERVFPAFLNSWRV